MIVTSKEMLVKNIYGKKDNRHFNRKSYYEMARKIAEECNKLPLANVTLANPFVAIVNKKFKHNMGRLKNKLKKMGFKNPLTPFRQWRDRRIFLKYNKLFKNVDYFNYSDLITMPNLPYFEAPYCFNVSYGMYRAVLASNVGGVDLNNDYIEHGLCYAEYAPLLLEIMKDHRIERIFTFSERRKGQLQRILAKKGYNNQIVAIGPMINKVPNFHSKEELAAIKKKIGKTLLVFPMHSWSGVDNDFDNDKLVMEIERLKPQFNTVLVCMYYMDIRKGKHIPYSKKGYTIVCNGDRFDTHFIQRHRDIIELSDLTMSNGIGTHVGYSIALNRPHYYFKQDMELNIDEKYKAESLEQEYRKELELEFVKVFGKFSYEINEEQKNFVKLYWGDF